MEALEDNFLHIQNYVIMTDREHMPQTSLPNVLCFEELLEQEDGDFNWLELDENSACGLCYTSGTTGDPKGVLYSHRSNYLHSMIAVVKNSIEIGADDCFMPTDKCDYWRCGSTTKHDRSV
jgi:fatty-acyl-CoA synthase